MTLTAYASAFWIMVANSFLQNPAGAVERGDHLVLTDFGALLTNPSADLRAAARDRRGPVDRRLRGDRGQRLPPVQATAEREFFTRSLRLGVITAFIGSLITVGFGYAQFGRSATSSRTSSRPRRLTGPRSALMIGVGQLLQLAIMFVLMLRRVLAAALALGATAS